MRYHQARAIREHHMFLRNCKICGVVLVLLVGSLFWIA